jgi:hypothetical protein
MRFVDSDECVQQEARNHAHLAALCALWYNFGVFQVRDDEPAPRVGAGLHRTP